MELTLRMCNEKDIDFVYILSNDPVVRENSLNSNFIPYEDHCKWYKASLINKNRIMYIAERNKIAIGQIRLDKQENKALISYSIEKNNRGKGYGEEIICLVKKEALRNGIYILEGLVKKNNIASIKAFRRSGFIETEEDEYYRYTCL